MSWGALACLLLAAPGDPALLSTLSPPRRAAPGSPWAPTFLDTLSPIVHLPGKAGTVGPSPGAAMTPYLLGQFMNSPFPHLPSVMHAANLLSPALSPLGKGMPGYRSELPFPQSGEGEADDDTAAVRGSNRVLHFFPHGDVSSLASGEPFHKAPRTFPPAYFSDVALLPNDGPRSGVGRDFGTSGRSRRRFMSRDDYNDSAADGKAGEDTEGDVAFGSPAPPAVGGGSAAVAAPRLGYSANDADTDAAASHDEGCGRAVDDAAGDDVLGDNATTTTTATNASSDKNPRTSMGAHAHGSARSVDDGGGSGSDAVVTGRSDSAGADAGKDAARGSRSSAKKRSRRDGGSDGGGPSGAAAPAPPAPAAPPQVTTRVFSTPVNRPASSLEETPAVARRHNPCNCKKSKCLKL